MSQKMAVKQAQTQAQAQAVSAAQSTAVIKNCVRLAVSTVAFARELFPKEAFVSKSYGGVNLEVLRPVDSKGTIVHEGALRIHEWLEKGAFKAMDQNYLEKVTFNILDAHPNDPQARVLESYSFKVTTGGPDGKGLAMSVNRKQMAGNSTISTTTTTSRSTVTKEEVHSAMQQLVKTLLILTSTLSPLPMTRWLSMSITYNDNAPANYEAPEFCPQDPSMTAKFIGDEPLVIPVGEINTGFHVVSLKFRQSVPDEEKDIPSTQPIAPLATNEAAGYDSDSTDVRWEKDKKDIIAMAERIARNAIANGESPSVAVRKSELAKRLPEDVLSDILEELKIGNTKAFATSTAVKLSHNQEAHDIQPFQPPPVPMLVTQKRTSRVKRPLQQISNSNKDTGLDDDSNHDDDAFETTKKKTRNTYSKKG